MHLINISGDSQTAYFKAVPMADITVEVRGAFQLARAVRSDRTLATAGEGEYTRFSLPLLSEYELVELRQGPA